MAAELLVAVLWGGVLVYWLWRRRPNFGDSIGSFQYELSVLGHATPTRVPPAHRLSYSHTLPRERPRSAQLSSVPPPADLPPSRQAAVRSYNRLEARRRRRDVLSVLLGAAILSLLFALVTGSPALLYLQLSTDLVLVTYLFMLVRATNSPPPRVARPDFPAAHVRRQRWAASYGDFGSYAELAAARAS